MIASSPRWRVAFLASHPTQYQAPLLRAVHADPEIDLDAWYIDDFSTQRYVDADFGRPVRWDVPLVDGYRARFLARGQPGKAQSWGMARPLPRTFAGQPYDVLWLHGYTHPAQLQAWAGLRRRGARVLLRGESPLLPFAATSSNGSGGAARLAGSAKAWARRRLLSQADGVLSIGQANRRFYRAHGVDDDKIFRMPYGVDHARFEAAAAAAATDREELRLRLGLPAKAPVLLFSAKLIERKRPYDLIEALRRLRAEGMQPLPALLFVGDGALREDLQAMAREMPDVTIAFAGFRNQTELPAFYDLADLLVLPSEFEPWGLVVNEAMACGRPALCSDRVGAAEDLVIEGRTGATFPCGNIPALAGAIARLLAEPHALRAMGAAAQKRVRAQDFEHAVAGLKEALIALEGI